MIAHLRRRLSILSLAAFLTDVDEMDLTAYRLAVIGEMSSKLTAELKARHVTVGWLAIYGMRNIIVHDYEAIEGERLWAAYAHGLDELARVCRAELGDDLP
jgi:uncharacterized protein with HEPN domain